MMNHLDAICGLGLKRLFLSNRLEQDGQTGGGKMALPVAPIDEKMLLLYQTSGGQLLPKILLIPSAPPIQALGISWRIHYAPVAERQCQVWRTLLGSSEWSLRTRPTCLYTCRSIRQLYSGSNRCTYRSNISPSSKDIKSANGVRLQNRAGSAFQSWCFSSCLNHSLIYQLCQYSRPQAYLSAPPNRQSKRSIWSVGTDALIALTRQSRLSTSSHCRYPPSSGNIR